MFHIILKFIINFNIKEFNTNFYFIILSLKPNMENSGKLYYKLNIIML